jgi:hypothetical protein
MPKMKAPATAGSYLQCSATGNNYQIDENGFVDVDGRDVPDLLKIGYVSETPAEIAADPVKTTFTE